MSSPSVRSLVALAGRFSLAGLLNTVVGFLAIIGCMWAGMGPYLSNAIGYAVGLSVSFLLQRAWVFNHRGPPAGQIARFGVGVAVAYGVNLGVLAGLLKLGAPPLAAQAAGAVAYSAAMFTLSTFWVFKRDDQ